MKIQEIGIVEWRISQKGSLRGIVWKGKAERVTLPYETKDGLTEGFLRVGLFGIAALNGR
ncbi:MAG: hypothetical protein GY941_04585 [Planctomycetes bacterium]|nr:hypothetical protein [Planctomycetota bacterium]